MRACVVVVVVEGGGGVGGGSPPYHSPALVPTALHLLLPAKTKLQSSLVAAFVHKQLGR